MIIICCVVYYLYAWPHDHILIACIYHAYTNWNKYHVAKNSVPVSIWYLRSYKYHSLYLQTWTRLVPRRGWSSYHCYEYLVWPPLWNSYKVLDGANVTNMCEKPELKYMRPGLWSDKQKSSTIKGYKFYTEQGEGNILNLLFLFKTALTTHHNSFFCC